MLQIQDRPRFWNGYPDQYQIERDKEHKNSIRASCYVRIFRSRSLPYPRIEKVNTMPRRRMNHTGIKNIRLLLMPFFVKSSTRPIMFTIVTGAHAGTSDRNTPLIATQAQRPSRSEFGHDCLGVPCIDKMQGGSHRLHL